MGRAAEPPAAIPGEPLQPAAGDPVAAAIAGAPGAASGVAVTPQATAATPVRTHHRGRIKVKEGSLLASRSQEEYAYIAKDLRHIAIVAMGLLGVLIVLWLFFTQVDPFGLY